MNKIENINLLPDTEPDSGDYTGEDGLLYCGKCRKPKEAYFPEGKTLFGLDRHPAECDCQRAVSYTHLDVYKRQDIGRTTVSFNFAANPADRGRQRVFIYKALVYIPQFF